MSVPLISQNFSDVLDPRFREIAMGQYDKGKSRIPDLFTVKTSDRDKEMYSSLTPMGDFTEFLGSLGYDGPEQEYDVTATHVEYALGMQIARKLYDDDQFGVIDEQFAQLGDSAFKTHEKHAAGLFTGSFSAANDFYSHTENVALCSNSHTTPITSVSTTTGFDNLGTSALTPVTLSAARLQMRQLKDAAGDICDILPTKLIVPANLEDTANEILKSSNVPYETSNTKNVNEDRFSLYVWSRLTDSNDWWVVNDELMKKNVYWFWRIKLELSKMESFDNFVAKARGYQRYSYLRRDWRWVVGNQVS